MGTIKCLLESWLWSIDSTGLRSGKSGLGCLEISFLDMTIWRLSRRQHEETNYDDNPITPLHGQGSGQAKAFRRYTHRLWCFPFVSYFTFFALGVGWRWLRIGFFLFSFSSFAGLSYFSSAQVHWLTAAWSSFRGRTRHAPSASMKKLYSSSHSNGVRKLEW